MLKHIFYCLALPLFATHIALAQKGEGPIAGPKSQQPDAPGIVITVRDAQIGKPLDTFSVLAGVPSGAASVRSSDDLVSWQPHTIRQGRNGALLWPTDRGYKEMFLRIESIGYHAMKTEKLLRDSLPESLDIKLTPNISLHGRILKPNGEPAAGAKLVFALPGRTIQLRDGKLERGGEGPPGNPSEAWRRPIIVTADDTGRFECFDEADTACVLIVMHDSGVRELKFAELKKEPQIKLQPWGRIEGEAVWGDIRPKEEQINLTVFRHDSKYPGLIEQYEDARTDATGHFSFNKVLPGQTQIAKLIPITSEPNVSSVGVEAMTEHVLVKPGGVTPALLGGHGRTIRGRFQGLDDWSKVTFSVVAAFRAPHIGFPGDTALWEANSRFQASPIGRMYDRTGLKPNPDGTFELKQVLPAQYHLSLIIAGDDKLAASARFEVAEEIPGEQPPPQDLPPIAIKAD